MFKVSFSLRKLMPVPDEELFSRRFLGSVSSFKYLSLMAARNNSTRNLHKKSFIQIHYGFIPTLCYTEI